MELLFVFYLGFLIILIICYYFYKWISIRKKEKTDEELLDDLESNEKFQEAQKRQHINEKTGEEKLFNFNFLSKLKKILKKNEKSKDKNDKDKERESDMTD